MVVKKKNHLKTRNKYKLMANLFTKEICFNLSFK